MKTKKIATYGLLVSLAFILSYLESLFPIPIPIPGIKIALQIGCNDSPVRVWSHSGLVLSIIGLF